MHHPTGGRSRSRRHPSVAKNGDLYVSELFAGRMSRIKKGTGVVKPWFSAPLTGDVEWTRHGIYATTHVLPPEEGAPNGRVVRLR